ncbi:hypothetical protein BS50DRAFT_616031 [Corynespora cassiicola Philippines]|uniref:Uncharacterized protein n=1 Tax=Corynespora cassiicola Philippines TaxID=1448308 RepID=A0A2T2PCF9_CORCC|nr:hypothetical protein BS50DRAFT_616031 [Corynespora cassiicola Philippines]
MCIPTETNPQAQSLAQPQIPIDSDLTPTIFHRCHDKGSQLLTLLHAPTAPTSPQSPFTNPSSLKKWGFTTTISKSSTTFPLLKTAFLSLGITPTWPAPGDKTIMFKADHHQSVEVAGTLYPETGAQFCQIVNHDDGFMIAESNYGHGWSVAEEEKMRRAVEPAVAQEARVWPELGWWSDVAFLQWISPPCIPVDAEAMPEVENQRNLKYVFRTNIENETTQEVVNRILPDFKKEKCTWPGVTFRTDSLEGRALLGTPNGAGVAWLLAQHREQLGWRVVDQVTVFQLDWLEEDEDPDDPDEERFRPTLLFWVHDVNSG